MLHPGIQLRYANDAVGYGLFARESLPAGTITWVLDALDLRLGPGRLRKLGDAYAELLEKYSFVDRQGDRILCWDFARFMNHGCNPNTLGPGLDFEMAVRPIEAGEEVTCDYGNLNIEVPFDCLCGSPECRHTVRPGDFERLAPVWDAAVRAAFPRLLEVAQPLLPFVADREALEQGVRNPESLPSILRNRYLGGSRGPEREPPCGGWKPPPP